MDKQEAGLPLDSVAAREREATLQGRAEFQAWLPATMTALRFHGDCGMRITVEVDDSFIEEVKKLIDWRDGLLQITVRPVPK